MAKTEKRKLGDFGESIALKFLMKRGFTLVEKNYLRPWGEIDLIVKKVNEYHFVEVKSSVSYETGSGDVNHETLRPEENIHPHKLERMNKAIQTYSVEHHLDEENIFIDGVIVHISPDYKKAKVVFLENLVL